MKDEVINDQMRQQLEAMEAKCLPLPQVPMPLVHHFAPGLYLREIMMPRGTFVIGHEHKTKHFNIVISGKARVMVDGVTSEIVAPTIFVSGAGVRKVLYILEDMRWLTAHPTMETDITKLEDELIVKSESFKKFETKKIAND